MKTNTFPTAIAEMQQALKFFALKFTQDTDEINDLVQETMLKALTNQDKYKKGTNLKAWLFTILKNQFINEYRKNSRKVSFQEGAMIAKDTDIFRDKVDTIPEKNMNIKDIKKSINSLDRNYRLPLQMYLHGYKYKDIAELLEIPLGTVKRRIFSSRRKLEKKLNHNAA